MNSPAFAHPAKPPEHSLADEVDWACKLLGLHLFDWQAAFLARSTAIRGPHDEAFVHPTVGLIVPRRNGKTLAVMARMIVGALAWNEKVLYTAHLGETSREVFTDLVDLINRSEWLRDRAKISYGRGAEEIAFRDAGKIRIRARTKSGGRGTGCDLLVLDEALELGEDHLSALLPLTAMAMSRGRGQVWWLSSAGHGGSVELGRFRDRGRAAAEGDDLCYAEFVADRDADPSDPETHRIANPSLGTPILSEAFISSQQRSLNAEAFGREHLGWWTSLLAEPLLPVGSWLACQGEAPIIPARARISWGIEVQQFGERATLVQAVDIGDGRTWVETLARWHEPAGLDGAALAGQVASLYRKAARRPVTVAGDSYTCSLLLDHMQAARLPVSRLGVPDIRQASGLLLTSVVGKRLSHPRDEDMAAEMGNAGQAANGDGLQRLSRRQSTGPSTCAFAVAAALHALEAPQAATPRIVLSA